jgi:hypothetical protein
VTHGRAYSIAIGSGLTAYWMWRGSILGAALFGALTATGAFAVWRAPNPRTYTFACTASCGLGTIACALLWGTSGRTPWAFLTVMGSATTLGLTALIVAVERARMGANPTDDGVRE